MSDEKIFDESPFDTSQRPSELRKRLIEAAHSPRTDGLPIFDPADVEREINALAFKTGDGGFETVSTEDVLPNEDRLRLATLRRILKHKLGAKRPHVFGTPAMAKRVTAIKESSPHFTAFIDLVARAVTLSECTLTPLRLPPILLLGRPGIGKTYVSKRLAASLGTGFHEIAMNMTDAFRLRGMNPSWKGAKMGNIASTLLESKTASPIILVDEFDKPTKIHHYENPHDIFHSLLEEENAAGFTDDYLQFPLRADQIIWIATGNSVENIAPSILDRLIVIDVPEPAPDQLKAVITNIYTAANTRYRHSFERDLPSDFLNYLTTHNPRTITRLLDLAFARAASDRRLALELEDIIKSEELLDGAARENDIGFLSRR